ncbi:hypothetical protein EDD15DRAFT_2315587 [Pisolithus albus]|nr:hypothetical protein EDD15DRAFT_2315587 [Pisolithus albus]
MSLSQRRTRSPAGRDQAPARVASHRFTSSGHPSPSQRHVTHTSGSVPASTPSQGQPPPARNAYPPAAPPPNLALPVGEGDRVARALPAEFTSTAQGAGVGPAVPVGPMTLDYLSAFCAFAMGAVVVNHKFLGLLSRPPITSGDISITAVERYSERLLFLAHLLSFLSIEMAINAVVIVYLSFFLRPADRLVNIDNVHLWLMLASVVSHAVGYGLYTLVVSYTLAAFFWTLFLFCVAAAVYATGVWSIICKVLGIL